MEKLLLQGLDQQSPHPAQAIDINIYRYGEEIMTEGVESHYFFVLLSGQVRISQRGKKVRLLDEQDVFGLENLLFRRPALYSARALGKSRIAKYGHEAFDYLIRKSPRMVQSILVSTLQQLTQTSYNLSKEPEAFTIDDVRVNFFSDGQVIVGEKSEGNDFYRLVTTQGGLKVTAQGEDIAVIGKPGEFFGGIASALNFPQQVVITSIGQSVVETYGLDDLDIIIKDHPEIALQIMKTLISRLKEANLQSSGTIKK